MYFVPSLRGLMSVSPTALSLSYGENNDHWTHGPIFSHALTPLFFLPKRRPPLFFIGRIIHQIQYSLHHSTPSHQSNMKWNPFTFCIGHFYNTTVEKERWAHSLGNLWHIRNIMPKLLRWISDLQDDRMLESQGCSRVNLYTLKYF